MKIVINTCYGGFGLSKEAFELYCDLTGQDSKKLYDREIQRNDPMLIHVVEKLGEKADDKYARLKIVEIPDGVDWEVEEYDGKEWVSEVHRTWG